MNASLPCLDVSDESVLHYVLVAEVVVDFCIIITALLLNTFIVISILSKWRTCTSTVVASASSRLVLSLAVSDILVAVACVYYLPFYYLCKTEYLDRIRVSCLFKHGFLIFAHAASWYGLVAIAVDRYIAVVHALRYSRLMSTRRVTGIIVLVWVMSIINTVATISVSPWTPDKHCDEAHVFSVYVFCIMIGGSFVFGIIAMSVTHLSVHKQAASMAGTSHWKTFIKSRSGCIFLFGATCFIVSFIPIITILFLRVLMLEIFSSEEKTKLATGIAFTVSRINFLVNPFLYAWRNATIKEAMKSKFQSFVVCLASVSSRKSETVTNSTVTLTTRVAMNPNTV